MNERIREFALQAGAGEWGDSVVPAMMDIEKFAELIVRECIGLLPEDCQSKNGCHTSWVMKEHFGVEE